MQAEIDRPISGMRFKRGIVYLGVHLFFARKSYLPLLSFTYYYYYYYYYYFHYHYHYHYFVNTYYLPFFLFTSLPFAEREAITKVVKKAD